MDLDIYDRSLDRLGVVDEITSLLWTRRHWSPGEFKLLAPFTPQNTKLLVPKNLIMKKGDNGAGEIKYASIKKNDFGKEVMEVQGKFVTSWLNKRILLNQLRLTDTSQNILYRIVTEAAISPANVKNIIPLLEIENNPANLESDIIEYVSELNISALLAAETVAKAAQLGFEITADIRKKKYIFGVCRGKDATTGQNENPQRVFSEEFENVYNQEFTHSIENLKTVCYVGGEEKEGVNRQIVEVGESSGLDRSEVFIDASDIKGASEQMLRERGIKELGQYAETLNFSAKINYAGNLIYKTDFDVGDIVTCVHKRWGIRLDVRITEVTESYQKEGAKIDVTFGEGFPELSTKIRQMR